MQLAHCSCAGPIGRTRRWSATRLVDMRRITRAELAAHCEPADCWVAVHGSVCDVTAFLAQHPGGASALCKAGRAGGDVSDAFDRIGHSAHAHALLSQLCVGTLVDATEEAAGPAAAGPVHTTVNTTVAGDEDAHALCVEWHAARRRAMLRAHPEIAELAGDNVRRERFELLNSILTLTLTLTRRSQGWRATTRGPKGSNSQPQLRLPKKDTGRT